MDVRPRAAQRPRLTVGFVLSDIARLMRRNFNRRVQSLGLTQAQWMLLARIARHEGAKQAQLAELLEMQPISVARLIDRMEASGWVERRPDPKDRRAVNLYLTKKAEPILGELWERAEETQTIALAGLSTANREDLLKALETVRENLIGDCSQGDKT
ncbi:MAG TPA: MarR family transcriptional regulator [Alphaproteobacteria bacterium]|nr:MarR family transcriptional regulator [Alphaproteobacteria bacterium]